MDGDRDREILHREAGRVEHRDVVVGCAPRLGAEKNPAELGDVGALEPPRVDEPGDVAVVARLRPLVAHDSCPEQLVDLDLGLARPVRAHQAHVLTRSKHPLDEDGLPSRGDA